MILGKQIWMERSISKGYLANIVDAVADYNDRALKVLVIDNIIHIEKKRGWTPRCRPRSLR